MSWHQWSDGDLILKLRVQPRASRDEIYGLHGDAIKVRITAPPVDGAANAHLCRYLARCFKVPKSHVSLINGEGGRDKRVRVTNPKILPDIIPSPT